MYFRILIIILSVSILVISCDGRNPKKNSEQVNKQVVDKKSEIEEIDWVYDLSKGLKLAKEKDKPLMIDFYADWCGWCKKLDKDTYGNPEVRKLSDSFVCVKVDTDKNSEDAQKYKVTGLPTIIFLKSDGGIIEKIIGFRDSEYFIKIMSNIIKKDEIQ